MITGERSLSASIDRQVTSGRAPRPPVAALITVAALGFLSMAPGGCQSTDSGGGRGSSEGGYPGNPGKIVYDRDSDGFLTTAEYRSASAEISRMAE